MDDADHKMSDTPEFTYTATDSAYIRNPPWDTDPIVSPRTQACFKSLGRQFLNACNKLYARDPH